MENALTTLADIEKSAKFLAPSFKLTIEQAIAVMLIGQSEGIHPVTALQQYDIIEGRPAPKATTVLAKFQNRGGKVDWLEYSATRAAGMFSHPDYCPTAKLFEITIDEAMQRNLHQSWDYQAKAFKPKHNWKYHTAAMLRARVVTAAVRMIDPGALNGAHIADELEDIIKDADVTAVDGKPTRLERAKALAEDADKRVADKATTPKPETKTPPAETKQAIPETKPSAAETQKQEDLKVRQAAANHAETRSRLDLPMGGTKSQPLFTPAEQAAIDARNAKVDPPAPPIEEGKQITIAQLIERAKALQTLMGAAGNASFIKRLTMLCEKYQCGKAPAKSGGEMRVMNKCPEEKIRDFVEDIEEDIRGIEIDRAQGGAA